MTVREMIEKLNKLDGDLPIVREDALRFELKKKV